MDKKNGDPDFDMTMEKFDGAELYNNALVESRFRYKITFQKQQNTSTVTNNTKNRKRRDCSPFSLNVSGNIGKNSLAYWVNFAQKHKLFNRNNVKVSYSSLPKFKSVINSHNKYVLNEQEKPSPCDCRDKTSYLVNRSCQHKNLVYACKVSTPDIKQNHLHYTGLTEHTFKDRLYKHNDSFEYKSKKNSTELSKFIWGKKKGKINVDLDWNILDKARE